MGSVLDLVVQLPGLLLHRPDEASKCGPLLIRVCKDILHSCTSNSDTVSAGTKDIVLENQHP